MQQSNYNPESILVVPLSPTHCDLVACTTGRFRRTTATGGRIQIPLTKRPGEQMSPIFCDMSLGTLIGSCTWAISVGTTSTSSPDGLSWRGFDLAIR